jgi:hypothetical protein
MKVSQYRTFQYIFKFLQVQSQKTSSAMMKLSLMRTATGMEDRVAGSLISLLLQHFGSARHLCTELDLASASLQGQRHCVTTFPDQS